MTSTSPVPTSYHFNFWNFWMARCPCPPEEQVGLGIDFKGFDDSDDWPNPSRWQVEGDFVISQVDRGVTVHWEAFEAS